MLKLDELWAEFEVLCRDDELAVASNLAGRAKALAWIAYLDRLARTRRHQGDLLKLQQQATAFQQRLEAINQTLFQTLRERIRTGAVSAQALRQEFDRYTAYTPAQPGRPYFGQEGLDVLVQGIWESEPPPATLDPRTPEMIHFERTPASVILEFIDRADFAPGRIFYDLGSGLGQVVMLVQVLTGVQANGVEIEPAYHAYARRQANALGLIQTTWINADARTVDYSNGDIFFLFTPFTGALLQTVLEQLQTVARTHPITIGSYGPCTLTLAQQPWLTLVDSQEPHEFKLAIFRSASYVS
jgi:hypothetical protein